MSFSRAVIKRGCILINLYTSFTVNFFFSLWDFKICPTVFISTQLTERLNHRFQSALQSYRNRLLLLQIVLYCPCLRSQHLFPQVHQLSLPRGRTLLIISFEAVTPRPCPPKLLSPRLHQTTDQLWSLPPKHSYR